MGITFVDPGYIARQKAENERLAKDSKDNALATATLAAPGEYYRNSVLKVESSYSSASVTGLLQIKDGTTVIAEKYIHGAGAIDFDNIIGHPSAARNQAMSAELAASGTGGVLGKVFLVGFNVKEG